MTSIKSVKWTLTSGKAIECIITATRESRQDISDSDGYKIDHGQKTYENTTIEILIDNKFYVNSEAPSLVIAPIYTNDMIKAVTKIGCVALMANGELPVNQNVYNQIMAAIAEAKEEASKDESYIEVKTVETTKEAIETAKEEAARADYEKELKNGLCPKCGTYCDGDCTAN